MFTKSIFMVLSLGLGAGAVNAAIPGPQTLYTQTLTKKEGHYLSDGVFTGGHAMLAASVLNVRHAYSSRAHVERVIVDLGDGNGKVAPMKLSYFQASVDSRSKRVVLDVSSLRMSKVSETQLKTLFKKSPYVANVEFTLDPEDHTGSMVLDLRESMRLEVFRLLDKGKPARLVMDLTPVKANSNKVRR